MRLSRRQSSVRGAPSCTLFTRRTTNAHRNFGFYIPNRAALYTRFASWLVAGTKFTIRGAVPLVRIGPLWDAHDAVIGLCQCAHRLSNLAPDVGQPWDDQATEVPLWFSRRLSPWIRSWTVAFHNHGDFPWVTLQAIRGRASVGDPVSLHVDAFLGATLRYRRHTAARQRTIRGDGWAVPGRSTGPLLEFDYWVTPVPYIPTGL